MQVGYFTERPYRWLPEEEILKHGAFFGVSNRLYDREKAADDYHYYLDENCYAEDLGFDVVALNEHHGNPICMGSVMNVEAAVLAYRTKRVRVSPDWESVAGDQTSVADGRRTGRDRSDLARPAGDRLGARRGQRAIL